jgi:murein DD-endopeptidase MepM/ murein hydrolase activator NlpD
MSILSAGGVVMQADDIRGQDNRTSEGLRGKSRLKYFTLGSDYNTLRRLKRSKRFRSAFKGLLIVAGCIALFSLGIFLGLRASFLEAPASGWNAHDTGSSQDYAPHPGEVLDGRIQLPGNEDMKDGSGTDGFGTESVGTATGTTESRQELTDRHADQVTHGSARAPDQDSRDSQGEDNQAVPAFDPYGIIMPVSGQIIKRPGWGYSEELGDWRYYPGVAISAEPGAEVKAAGSGVIKRVYRDEGVGLVIVIDHGDRYETRYAGVSAPGPVPGQQVSRGETIGRTEGDILRFELFEDGEAVDPAAFTSDGS